MKNVIKLSIEKSLNEQFNDKLYDTAIIFGLIDFDFILFKKFVASVPDMSNLEDDRLSYGNFENIKLDQVINIAYKYGLVFDDELKQLCNKAHKEWKDYYTWLMDIDGFDYTKFNHYWILEYGTVYYYEQFRKSEKLKKEIVKALNNDYIEGVAKVYFKELV